MNIKELEKLVNEEVKNIQTSKCFLKGDIVKVVNKILEEEGYKDIAATYNWNSRENRIEIKIKYPLEAFWPIYIYFKTKRVTVNTNRFYPEYNYVVKSVEFNYWDKRETAEGKEVEIKTLKDYIKAEKFANKQRADEKDNKINKLKNYIEANPEFVEMAKLYETYKYSI